MSTGTCRTNDLGKDFRPDFLGSDNFEDRARYALATILLKPTAELHHLQDNTVHGHSQVQRQLHWSAKESTTFSPNFYPVLLDTPIHLFDPTHVFVVGCDKPGLGNLLIFLFSSAPSFG